MNINRRKLLTSAVVTLGLLAFPSYAFSSNPDVIVIGAGAAGLSATSELLKNGYSVVCIEANNRIGGRAYTDNEIFGLPFDVGAHWIQNSQNNPFIKYGETVTDQGFDIYKPPTKWGEEHYLVYDGMNNVTGTSEENELWATYKKVENAINYSSILPIIVIIFAISQLYTTERINKNEIDSFSRGLTKIEKKWFEQDVSDKDIREGYYEDVNNHIDSFLRKLKGKTRDIIKEVKIIKNEQFKLEDDFFESKKKINEIDLLTSPIQNLEDINRYINSTEKIIEHINNRKNVSTKIRDSYLLHKRYGIELQVFTSIYLSYVNNEISENEYNGLIEKPYNKLVKTLEEMSQ